MSKLDSNLNNQQRTRSFTENKYLLIISKVYMVIGCIAIAIGFIGFISGICDLRHNGDALFGGIGTFLAGVFAIFAGCIGEAIDDIRNSLRK